jgi:hypothetical protein
MLQHPAQNSSRFLCSFERCRQLIRRMGEESQSA